jgi:hypothetical protein
MNPGLQKVIGYFPEYLYVMLGWNLGLQFHQWPEAWNFRKTLKITEGDVIFKYNQDFSI